MERATSRARRCLFSACPAPRPLTSPGVPYRDSRPSVPSERTRRLSKELDMSSSHDSRPYPLQPRPYPARQVGHTPYPGTKVLVLDADPQWARASARQISELGCGTLAPTLNDCLRHLDQEVWDVIVLGPSALPEEALTRVESASGAFILACDTTQVCPQRVHAYLSTNPDSTSLRHALGRAFESSSLAQENARLKQALHQRHGFGSMQTKDKATAAALEVARSVASTRANVLLSGESGTGKTLLARILHEHSDRAAAPFVTVNCGSLPDNLLESELFGHLKGAFSGAHQDRQGRIEAAHGGTLFLDEINSASLDLQVKLLRVLQERVLTPVGGNAEVAVDIRLVTATNQDLEAEIRAGRFREDLFYRIHVVSIELPPLRRRMGDLKALCDLFIERFAQDYGKSVQSVSDDCLAVLAGHDWPGNIRQLENALERGVLMAPGIELLPEHLGNEILEAVGWQSGQPAPGSLSAGLAQLDHLPSLREALEDPEMAIITRALELCSGNRKHAAAMLDINRSTLFNKMRKYSLMDLRFQ